MAEMPAPQLRFSLRPRTTEVTGQWQEVGSRIFMEYYRKRLHGYGMEYSQVHSLRYVGLGWWERSLERGGTCGFGQFIWLEKIRRRVAKRPSTKYLF